MNRGTLKTYSRVQPKRSSRREIVNEDDSEGSTSEKEKRNSSPSPSTSKKKGNKSPRPKSSKQNEEINTSPEGEKHKGWASPRSSSGRRKSESSPQLADEKKKSVLQNKKLKKESTPRRDVEKSKKVSPRLANEKRKRKDSSRVSDEKEEDIPITEKENVTSSLITSEEREGDVVSELSTVEKEVKDDESRGATEEQENTVQITATKKKGKYRPKPASKKSKEIHHSGTENEENKKNAVEETQEDEQTDKSMSLPNLDSSQKVEIPPTLTTETLIKVLEDDSDEDSKIKDKSAATDENVIEKLKNGQPIQEAFVKLIRVDNFLKNMINKQNEAREKERLKKESEIEKKRKIEAEKKNLEKKNKSEMEKKNKIEKEVKESERKRGRPRKSKVDDPSVEIPLADFQVSATPTFSMQTRKRKLKFRLDGSLVKSDDEDQRLPSDSGEESETLPEEIEKSQKLKSSNKNKQKSKQTKFDKSNFDFATYYKDRASGKFNLDNEENNVEQKKYVAERDSIDPAFKFLSSFMNSPIIPADVVHETYTVNELTAAKLPKVMKKGDIRPRGPRVEKNFNPYIYEDSQDYIMLSCAEELFEGHPQVDDNPEEESNDEEDNVLPSPTVDGSFSLVNSPLETVKDMISKSIKGMDGWNVTMIKGSSSLFIGLIAIGRMGMPILKKSVQIDDNFSAKVFIHQLHCKRYDGIYNTIDSILSLIKEVDSLVA